MIKVDSKNKAILEKSIPLILAYHKISLIKFVEKEISLDDIYKEIYTKENRG